MPENNLILFINSDFQTLFYLPDGGRIRITSPDGRQADHICHFNSSRYTWIGEQLYHIKQFAEHMEKIGAKYEPLDYVKEPEYYPEYFLLADDRARGPAYYYIDETETHAFAFAPKGAEPGKRYCILEWKPMGESFKVSSPVQWGGSLREIRPQDWGFNMAKIKAVTQKPKKRAGPKRRTGR